MAINYASKVDYCIRFSFKDLDHKRYGFQSICKHSDSSKFAKFMDISECSEDYFFSKKRKNDKTDTVDTVDGKTQLEHYMIDDGFRIHGYFLGNVFRIVRIDVNHKFHD